jgi:hypothetical protein
MTIRPYQAATEADLEKLVKFAESFGQRIDPRLPYLVFLRPDAKWVGFAAMVSVPPPGGSGIPVVFTAWHPETSPEDVERSLEQLTDWAVIAYGRCSIITKDDPQVLPHLEKLGYAFMVGKLYTTR